MKDNSFRLGRFTVESRPVPGIVATRFSVYLSDKLIGSQFSYPTVENCEAMLVPRVTMASVKVFPKWSIGKSPGRPKKGTERVKRYGDDLD